MVALDSAVILNPTVWEASGHVAGFTDPLIDCRTCKLRFRADRLEDAHCGKRPSKRPGETPAVRPHRGAAVQPDVRDAGRRDGGRQLDRVPPPGDRAGHLHQLQERRYSLRGASRRSASRRSASRSATRSRRATSSSACASSSRWRWSTSSRRTRRSAGTSTGSSSGFHGTSTSACGDAVAHPRARAGGALALLERDERHRVPLPDRLAGARGRREPRRLRPHAAHAALRHEARVGRAGRRAYTPHVIEPAVSIERIFVAMLVDAYHEEVVADRDRTVLRLHPQIAPIKAAILPLIPSNDDMVTKARGAPRGAAAAVTSSSTTTAARSGAAIAGRTRSARRGRSRSTTRRSRTRR